MTPDAPLTTEDVVQRLTELAETGPLPAERVLAEQLGVNRYALRKALTTLRKSDAIPHRVPRRSGKRKTGAAQISLMTSPAELWEVRLLMEPEITRLAAVRGTEMEIRAIEEAHAAAEPNVFDLEQDIVFHHAIAVASHNALATHLMDQVMDLTRDDAFRTMLPEFTTETGWRHHAAIVEAIRGRRAADAEDAMRTHLTAILQWLNGGSDALRQAIK